MFKRFAGHNGKSILLREDIGIAPAKNTIRNHPAVLYHCADSASRCIEPVSDLFGRVQDSGGHLEQIEGWPKSTRCGSVAGHQYLPAEFDHFVATGNRCPTKVR